MREQLRGLHDGRPLAGISGTAFRLLDTLAFGLLELGRGGEVRRLAGITFFSPTRVTIGMGSRIGW